MEGLRIILGERSRYMGREAGRKKCEEMWRIDEESGVRESKRLLLNQVTTVMLKRLTTAQNQKNMQEDKLRTFNGII